MLLGEFNSKAGREDAFKATIGNERLHEISNNNGVIVVVVVVVVVNFATSKYCIMSNAIICILHQILLGWSNQG
jgi:hypothetical protein